MARRSYAADERAGFHGCGGLRNAATLVRRFFLSALPVERPSTPRAKRRRAKPAVAGSLPAAPRAVRCRPRPPLSFAAAGVPAPLVAALAAAGITTPFPIQAATLPDALSGRDILGRGQTGSGKTLGFCIPLAARLADGYTSACRPRGLVLVPTRELASQVHAVLAPLAESVGLSVATIYGGVPQRPQVAKLRARADIVVACPGRLADLIEQGHCHLGDVEISVLDEADHMADLGFLPVVRRLLDMTPPDGQRMLFSATLDAAVDVLARRFMNRPVHHDVGPRRGAGHDGPPPADRRARRPGRRGRRPRGRQRPVARLHPDQACRPPARPPADRERHPGRRTARGPGAGRAGTEPGLLRGRRRSGSSSRPTSPPAASTWTASTW